MCFRESEVPQHLRRYRPHLPESLVVETVEFLKSSSKIRSLLELIFSPANPSDGLQDRQDMQAQIEVFHLNKQVTYIHPNLTG